MLKKRLKHLIELERSKPNNKTIKGIIPGPGIGYPLEILALFEDWRPV